MNPIIGYAAALDAHPEEIDRYGFEYAWLEGVMKAELKRKAEIGDGWRDFLAWPQGRLFGEAGEYRWRYRKNHGIHAVLILDKGTLPQGFGGEIQLKVVEDSHLILWGEWVDPEKDPDGNSNGAPRFYAGEIPEIQTYPLGRDAETLRQAADGDKTPRIKVRYYCASDDASGGASGRFGRCVSFCLKNDEKKDLDDETDQSIQFCET